MRSAHDFHFSRTDMRWNPSTRTIQTTIRVFTDDLELALRNHHDLGDDIKIWLGDENEWPGADEALFDWLNANMSLSVEGLALPMKWVGKEIELDVSYLYLESDTCQARGAYWNVTNRLFFNEFDDQVNELHISAVDGSDAPSERREMLNWELPSLVWDSEQSETDGSDD